VRPDVPSVPDRLSDAAQSALACAHAEAGRLGHQRVGTEHLLLGLLAAPPSPSARALEAAGVTLEAARDKVAEAGAGKARGSGTTGEPTLTSRAERALARAARASLQRPDAQVSTEDLLSAVLDVEGTAGQVLRGVGVDLGRLRADLAAGAGSSAAGAPKRVADRADDAAPRCAACGKTLDGGLASGVLPAVNQSGRPQPFLIAWCAHCGAVVPATPAGP
jgi:ATP-dependent Clp protease ATP-binding subunit ClpC